jgi:hypothetical protein
VTVKTYKKYLKPVLLLCVFPSVLLYTALCMGAHPVFSLVSLFVRL